MVCNLQPDEWLESLRRLYMIHRDEVGRGYRDMPQNNVVFSTDRAPSSRQSLRRQNRVVSLIIEVDSVVLTAIVVVTGSLSTIRKSCLRAHRPI
jgi:hypothetical protein